MAEEVEAGSSGKRAGGGFFKNMSSATDKFHTIPVEEWDSYDGGMDYKKFLKSTNKEELSYDQKDDLKRLEEYEQGLGKEDEARSFNFEEEKVDYSRANSLYKLAFLLSLENEPDFFLSEMNLNTRNWVITMHKTKKMSEIVDIAKEKAEKQLAAQEDVKKNTEKTSDGGEKQEETPKKKKGLFAIIVEKANAFCEKSAKDDEWFLNHRESVEENDLHSTIEKFVDENNRQVSNNSNEPISKETTEDLKKKAQQILDEEQLQ